MKILSLYTEELSNDMFSYDMITISGINKFIDGSVDLPKEQNFKGVEWYQCEDEYAHYEAKIGGIQWEATL